MEKMVKLCKMAKLMVKLHQKTDGQWRNHGVSHEKMVIFYSYVKFVKLPESVSSGKPEQLWNIIFFYSLIIYFIGHFQYSYVKSPEGNCNYEIFPFYV